MDNTNLYNFSDKHEENHECVGRTKGNWIIFECPSCDYVRKIHWPTGKMHVSGGTAEVRHSGFHMPDDYKIYQYNQN